MSGGISATTIAAYAAVAGTALSVYGQVQQADQAKDAANAQQTTAAEDAAYANSDARLQARTIRKAAEQQRAEARASLAGAGVVVGEGTAEQIDKTINANAEQDALTAIYDGTSRARAITQSGNLAASRSRNAATAAQMGAFSSALQGGSTIARGWNTSAAGTKRVS